MSKDENNIKWYESGNVITTLIILTILAAIFCSQAFAVAGEISFSIITSVINHNSLYLVVLIYFALLKTRFGKKYFNYLNVFLVFFYFVSMVTSALTVIQSFSLNTILGFCQNLVIVLYLFHTMFRDTRIWREYHLGKSPFNELKNDGYYYALLVLVAFSLAVNLISTVVVSGLFVSILDALYLLLFGRYIYLYHEYLDFHQLDVNNEGNFDEIRENISTNINGVLDKTDIDEKIVGAASKVVDATKDLLDKTDVDEKIMDTASKVKDSAENLLKKEDKVDESVKEEKKTSKKKGETK